MNELTREQVEKLLQDLPDLSPWRHIRADVLRNDAVLRARLDLKERESIQIVAALNDDDVPTDEPLSLVVEDARKLRAGREAERERAEKAAAELEEIKTVLGCHRAYILDTIKTLLSKTEDIPNIDRLRQSEQQVADLTAKLAAMTQERESLRAVATPFLRFRHWANQGILPLLVQHRLMDMFGDIESATIDTGKDYEEVQVWAKMQIKDWNR